MERENKEVNMVLKAGHIMSGFFCLKQYVSRTGGTNVLASLLDNEGGNLYI